ncbi:MULTISPECIES: LPS assembly lipoprotein LptE [Chloracidobacterium]|nr:MULTISPECIES: LptE family protein [Chloracidobacterium]QUV79556.1 LptE family protein [Chloracidobacterium thermophilum]QUV82597.1 LptE family protein [Chloracidobacterium sp. D]
MRMTRFTVPNRPTSTEYATVRLQPVRWWGRPLVVWLLLLGCVGAGPCGYRRLDAGGAFPPEVKTLAVLPFTNQTLRYRIEQRFTQAVIEEILRRRLPVVLTNKPEQSDAVLSGDILAVTTGQALVDNRGTVRLFQVAIRSRVTLRDQTRNRVLFDQPNLEFRGEYEFSSDPRSFFNEEDPAVERLARDFARSVVTTMLERF